MWFVKGLANLSDRLMTVGRLLTRQCEFIAAQRLRRASQVCALYRRLYGESTLRNMVIRFESGYGGHFGRWRRKPLTILLGAAFFSWDKEAITEDEIQRCADDLEDVTSKVNAKCAKPCSRSTKWQQERDWEVVIDHEHLKMWRRNLGGYLYEYKVYGSFFDIPAWAFFDVQLDIDYRKNWDNLVISLDVVDQDETSGCEVVHWVMHYPFPMYSRDYVYIRRHHVDPNTRTMVLVSKATEHPSCPISDKYVRVSRYASSMVIKPHSHFDNNGFDYVLTYFDDPQAMFPGPAYSWMASSGVPDFVEKLHQAALNLQREKMDKSSVVPYSSRRDFHHCQTKTITNTSSSQMPLFA